MKFRKKPVVIEAERWDGVRVPPFVWEGKQTTEVLHDGDMLIETLEGTMRANIGDWIIKGIKGELYPCKPDIFEATYETVE